MEKNESRIMVNGRIVNIKNAPIDELKRMEKELKMREQEVRKQIDDELDR